MNRTELVAGVAEKTGLGKKDSKAAVSAVFELIGRSLASGEKTQIFDFGSFEIKKRPARTGHNPRTKAPITIAESKRVAFRAGKALRDSLQKK
jgi:DNA-binding protein HU-beta